MNYKCGGMHFTLSLKVYNFRAVKSGIFYFENNYSDNPSSSSEIQNAHELLIRLRDNRINLSNLSVVKFIECHIQLEQARELALTDLKSLAIFDLSNNKICSEEVAALCQANWINQT
jgi:hypothetical protein